MMSVRAREWKCLTGTISLYGIGTGEGNICERRVSVERGVLEGLVTGNVFI